MTLTPGTRLGAYEIVAPIGAGGMGEVYRALDARLGREVADKVLPASVSSDPETLARFEREARAVGALISPDGKWLAIARADGNGLFGIWKYDIARNVDSQVTGVTFTNPTWSPDSRSIITGATSGLFRFDADAVTPPQLLRSTTAFVGVQDISPDGREALGQFGVVPLDGSTDPKPIAAGAFAMTYGAFSPDGKWIALATLEGAALEGAAVRFHVQPHPGPGARIPVTNMPVGFQRWRGDGRELYAGTLQDGQPAMVAIPVSWTGGTPNFGAPQVLFKAPRLVLTNFGFDVTADGQRFVMVMSSDPDPTPLSMVVRAVVR